MTASAKVQFSESSMKRFKETVAKYEVPKSALLPTLWIAQEEFGYLTPPVLDYVAQLLEIPANHVYDTVSFYFMFKKKDWGKHCIQVCNNITCSMMGSEEIIHTVETELGIKVNDVTADKQMSLQAVQCLGACDVAPVLQVNEDYFENVTPEKMKKIISDLRGAK
jgi:NADH-quinone oxidoreductase E subunit